MVCDHIRNRVTNSGPAAAACGQTSALPLKVWLRHGAGSQHAEVHA